MTRPGMYVNKEGGRRRQLCAATRQVAPAAQAASTGRQAAAEVMTGRHSMERCICRRGQLLCRVGAAIARCIAASLHHTDVLIRRCDVPLAGHAARSTGNRHDDNNRNGACDAPAPPHFCLTSTGIGTASLRGAGAAGPRSHGAAVASNYARCGARRTSASRLVCSGSRKQAARCTTRSCPTKLPRHRGGTTRWQVRQVAKTANSANLCQVPLPTK